MRAEARRQLLVSEDRPSQLDSARDAARRRTAQEVKEKGQMLQSGACLALGQTLWCWGGSVGRAWPGAMNAGGLSSRDGQEVAVVYYREGYVPKNYDQQVSADCSAPRSLPR